MVLYYYDKYNAISSWGEPPDKDCVSGSGSFSGAPKGAIWSPVTKSYTPSGGTWKPGDTVSVGQVAWHFYSSYAYRSVAQKASNDAAIIEEQRQCTRYFSESPVVYSRGSLVQSNITAEEGSFPNNGVQSGYWYVKKGIANQNPVITPSTVPSGSISVKPSFNYTATDPDGNTMTVTESIDGIVFNTRTSVASGTQLTFTPTDLTWLRTRIKQTVNLTIKADDGKGGVTTVNYPITRTTPAIDLQLKAPFETDVAARRLLLKLEGSISIDATVSVQACNNAFDANPTWENATNLVLNGFPYSFTNKTKTAVKWGVSFKIRIERGNSAGTIFLDGVGGAYD